MNRQIIISVGREYGSGGHEVAKRLADKLDIPFYDRNLLDEVADNKDADIEELSRYDEAPHKPFFSRTVRGFSNSPSVNVAELQFALLKSKAADEDSFVVVGRCADELFRDNPNCVSLFIYSDHNEKVKRIMELFKLSEKDAVKKMERHDKKRRAYHDYFSSTKWGEIRSYDLCVNSSKLGIDGTVNFIYEYIQEYFK